MIDYAEAVKRLVGEATELTKHGNEVAAQEEKEKAEGRLQGRDFALRLCWKDVRVLSQESGLNWKYRKLLQDKCSSLVTEKSTAFALAFRVSLTETCVQLVADVGAKFPPAGRKPPSRPK